MQFLNVGLIACITLLVYVSWRLWGLSEHVDALDARLDLASHEAQETSAAAEAMLARADKLESQVKSLEQMANAPSKALKKPSPEQLDGLLSGLYELETSSQYDPELEETSPYTITHVVVDFQYETYGTKMHVGMARSGMIPKGVYFDYNNDGQIDVDMALNFVRDIPVVGRSLAKVYDTDIAQSLYSIFVSEAANAEYTSVEDMSDDAEAASSYIWTFVMDQYDDIEIWVFENLQESENDL